MRARSKLVIWLGAACMALAGPAFAKQIPPQIPFDASSACRMVPVQTGDGRTPIGCTGAAGLGGGSVGGLNVRDFGAVGNGSTDDTGAFKAALATAASGGLRTVFVPPGTYQLNAKLSIAASYISLVGLSPETTTLQFSGNGDLISVAAPALAPGLLSQISIAGIKLQCTSPHSSGWMIDVEGVSALTIRDLIFDSCFSGIRLAGVYGATLEAINAKWPRNGATGKIGLSVEAASSSYGGRVSSQVRLSNSEINSVWNPGQIGQLPGLDTALRVTAVDGLFITNDYLASCALACVVFDNVSTQFITGVLVANTWIDHGTGLAIETKGAVADNFGDLSFVNLRIFGAAYSTGLVRLGGNVKRVNFSGGSYSASRGDLFLIALTGNGGDIGLNNLDLDYTNQRPTTAVAAVEITGGTNVTVRGGILRLRGYGLMGVKVSGGSGHVIAPDRITECSTPVQITAGASQVLVDVGNYAGCTTTTVSDAGTGTVVRGTSP